MTRTMKFVILVGLLLFSSLVSAQVVLINPSKAGVEILPEGIRAGFLPKPTDTTNVVLGRNALLNNTLGHGNVAIGINALKNYNVSSTFNDLNIGQIAIGNGAMGSYNPAGPITSLGITIGKNALGNVTDDARNNIVIGSFASLSNRGDGKIVIGNRALSAGGTDTDGGIYFGHNAANFAPSSGAGNVIIGNRAMFYGGSFQNTIVGEEAGYGLSSSSKIGQGNVFLGFRAGKNETGSNLLYIENSDSSNALIGGDFVFNRVGINRTLSQINATNRNFQVEGTAYIKDTLQLPLGAGSGKILTSDSEGNASWQSPTSSGLWQQNGNYISNTNPGGFWSPYVNALPVTADNTSYPPQSPSNGNGTRMAWIPGRSAFQGGTFNMADGSVRFVSENIGLFSFCYGLNSESRSRAGVAIGEGAIADGTSNTLAFGENVQVRGQRNVGIGFVNEIVDGSSNTIAVGEGITNTGGEYVNAVGWGLQSAGYGTSFFGTFNAIPTGSLNSWVSTDPLFVIGNGQPNAVRSNALVIQKNGVMNIGISSITSTTYRLRVGGSIYSSSTIQGLGLRAENLAGTGERHVCADASGNLIPCSTSSTASFYNVSAMGFQPIIYDVAATNSFQRDVAKCLVSFINGTKSAYASLYAPVELPQGFEVNKVVFNFLQNSGGTMTLKFQAVPKQSISAATTLVSITSFLGSGVLEKAESPTGTITIDNENYYYFLSLDAGANWQGSDMALRGVVFSNSK